VRLKTLATLAVAGLAVFPAGSTVAGPPVGGGPVTSPPPIPGPITVQYNDSGGVSSTTSIPHGSAFRNQGGSDRAPCQYTYFADTDGDGHVDGPGELRDSMQWKFVETTDFVVSLTDSEWEAVSGLSGMELSDALATFGPVESAQRRFNVFCVGQHGSGTWTNEMLGSVLVGIWDPFWRIAEGVTDLRNGIQLDRPQVATIPAQGLFGGLPVNMPASLQIDSGAWKAYVSSSTSFRGYVSRLLLQPESLVFDAAFVPDAGPAESVSVLCLSGFTDEPDIGNVPPRSPAVPDFAEPGQGSWPCVWIPPRPGEVTIRATITYSVTLVVSGPPGTFTEVQEAYTWSSDPLILRVDELRAVNTNPGD
jgi:hypothetical protein